MDTQSGGVAFISGATFQQTMLPAKVIYRGWATAVPSLTQRSAPIHECTPIFGSAQIWSDISLERPRWYLRQRCLNNCRAFQQCTKRAMEALLANPRVRRTSCDTKQRCVLWVLTQACSSVHIACIHTSASHCECFAHLLAAAELALHTWMADWSSRELNLFLLVHSRLFTMVAKIKPR